MIIYNNSKNTIHLDDIDDFIPYQDEKHISISAEKLKRSKCLRNAIINGLFTIVSHDENEHIEKSVVYMSKKHIPQPTPKTEMEYEPVPHGDGIEVKIHGLFYDSSGYSKVNRNLALQLNKMGFKVKIDGKTGQNQICDSDLTDLLPLSQTRVSRNHILIDSVIPSFGEASSGKYKILYTTIESYTVPKQFLDACQNYQEVWTTGRFGVDILKKYIKDKPIYAVQTGADPDLYKEEGDKFNFKPNVKDFVFLSVFTWGYRKGPDVLCRAYFDEFSASDNVSLLIMSRYQSGKTRHHKEKIKIDIDKYMTEFPNKDLPHLVRFNQIISEKDMPKLYRSANSFILTTRGECIGLPPLEASLCGLPVIMTNCSGQQEYLREDNSYRIEIDRISPLQPGMSHLHYWDGQEFPELTSKNVHNQVKKLMREVYDNYDEAKERNKKLQKLILSKYTWKHNAITAADRLKQIHKNLENLTSGTTGLKPRSMSVTTDIVSHD